MGCGASRTDVLKSVVSENSNPSSKGQKSKTIKQNSSEAIDSNNGNNNSHTPNMDSLNSEGSTIPASEKYQNLNGTHNENLKPLNLPSSLPPLKPPRTFKLGNMDQADGNAVGEGKSGPIAFEVPAAEVEGAESLIKKHPPRRLRKIIDPEQSPESVLTHDLLEEKTKLANERRNHVLTQRVASARQKSARNPNRIRKVLPESEILKEFANAGMESGTAEENELASEFP